MNKTLKIMGIIIGGFFILLIGGCAIAIVGVSKSVSDSEKNSANVSKLMPQVKMGMTKDQVISILGKPGSAQQFNDSYSNESCIYYGILDWQLCFTDGYLDTKNKY